MAEKACHVVASATQVGLTQALAVMSRMRVLYFTLAALLAACTLQQAHVHEVDAPGFVQELAETALDPADEEHKEQVQAFADGFLQGYLRPYRPSHAPDSPYELGIAAGRRSRESQTNALSEVLPGFGYSAVTLDGNFSFGFEQFAFVPADSPEEKWWLVDATNLPGSDFGECSGNAVVTGFLSPRGSYGHLGAYKRLLVVSSSRCTG